MMRVCHLDTCPVGVATQNPLLRKRFTGTPEFVENFFRFLAEEVREYLAELGFRTLDEAIGQVELLDPRPAVDHWKAAGLDLTSILFPPMGAEGPRSKTRAQDHRLDRALDNLLIANAAPALDDRVPVAFSVDVRNENRSVGAMLGGEVARRHGGAGLPDDTIDVTLHGTAGQSFGAFVPRGVTLRLFGDANDYVGKGLSGGRIIVRPDETAPFVLDSFAEAGAAETGAAEAQIIAGNTILYGATDGQLFLRGQVGERFAVRNSGASAVVEGVGNHGCEYMTGGVVVVLGPTGLNFGAGMSGGFAFVWQLDEAKVNRELVDLNQVSGEHEELLRGLVEQHFAETGSRVARRMLDNWAQTRDEFTAVIPRDYQRVVQVIRAAQAAGREIDETVMAELAAPPASASASTPTSPSLTSPRRAGDQAGIAEPEVARA
jgi:glutamate synthase (NADPH/NADH) large chain